MLVKLSTVNIHANAAALVAVIAVLHCTPSQAQVSAVPPAAAAAPVEPAAPNYLMHTMRAHQVWRDEMPAQVDAAEVEVIVHLPDSRCNPPVATGLFGLKTSTLHPHTAAFCRRLTSFVQAPAAPLPLPVRVSSQALSSRQPQAVLAAMEPAPTRRYVALLVWDWVQHTRNQHWMFEIAVVDRRSGRWVWHGARNNEISDLRDWRAKDELTAVQALLLHQLPRDLLAAAWWQKALPVPDGRWVPPAALASYQPEPGRAGLVVTNSYYSDTRLVDNGLLKLWPAGTPEVDDTPAPRQGDHSDRSTLPRAQSTPPLAPDTYLLLDLPAGEYTWRLGQTVENLSLPSGQIVVMNMWRRLGNSWGLGQETEAWWRERIEKNRVRHAFFSEPPDRGWPAVVPYFMNLTP